MDATTCQIGSDVSLQNAISGRIESSLKEHIQDFQDFQERMAIFQLGLENAKVVQIPARPNPLSPELSTIGSDYNWCMQRYLGNDTSHGLTTPCPSMQVSTTFHTAHTHLPPDNTPDNVTHEVISVSIYSLPDYPYRAQFEAKSNISIMDVKRAIPADIDIPVERFGCRCCGKLLQDSDPVINHLSLCGDSPPLLDLEYEAVENPHPVPITREYLSKLEIQNGFVKPTTLSAYDTNTITQGVGRLKTEDYSGRLSISPPLETEALDGVRQSDDQKGAENSTSIHSDLDLNELIINRPFDGRHDCDFELLANGETPDSLEKILEARRQNQVRYLVLGMSGWEEDTYRDFEGILHD